MRDERTMRESTLQLNNPMITARRLDQVTCQIIHDAKFRMVQQNTDDMQALDVVAWYAGVAMLRPRLQV